MRRMIPRRITLRARLTLIYGGLFLAAGVVLLGVTYLLFDRQLDDDRGSQVTVSSERAGPASHSYSSRGSGTPPPKVDDPATWMANEQKRLNAAATTSLITQGAIALAVVGGLAAGIGWLVAGRVLAPLHRVTDTARRIAGAPAADRGLHERIALRGPDDEVKDLADTFDTMVERLDRSFDGQRRFVANASHELRTPLTLGRALVEMAMHRESAGEDIRRLGENLLQINTRHERLITGLLLLTSSEREIPERLPVDLADVVSHVIAQTAAEAERSGVLVHEEIGEAATLGDALLLERLVQNLVENGIRHGDGWMRVTTRIRDGRAELEVANGGPVIPPYEIPRLFEPFSRLDTDRLVTAKGAGLGLSIVSALARAHDGDVTARPREGGGLTIVVGLPLDRQAAVPTRAAQPGERTG